MLRLREIHIPQHSTPTSRALIPRSDLSGRGCGRAGYSIRSIRAGGTDRKAGLRGTAVLTNRRSPIVGPAGVILALPLGFADDVVGAADTPHLSSSAA